MSAKHTPGPARWVRLETADKLINALGAVASHFDSMREEDGYVVPAWLRLVREARTLVPVGPDADETLVSAAPQLLEAAKLAVSMLRCPSDHLAPDDWIESADRALSAAIAKAGG